MNPHAFDWLLPEQLGACVNPSVGEHAALELESGRVRLLINLHERPDPPEMLSRLNAEPLHLPVSNSHSPTQDQLERGVAAIAKYMGMSVHLKICNAASEANVPATGPARPICASSNAERG